MKLLLIGAAMLAFAQDTPLEVGLPAEDQLAIVQIERAQYRALAAREAAYAKMLKSVDGVAYLNADLELQGANLQMDAKIKDLQKRLQCFGCDLIGDTAMRKPLPKTITNSGPTPGTIK